ncbi:MAG: DUF5721 family protein [Dorea sp.]
MIVLNLKAKNCMSHLLLKPTFDEFALIEGEITTFNKFTIDGYIQKDFYEKVPENTFSYWKDLREFCFSIIKGKRTPLNFKFVLSLAQKDFEEFLNMHSIEGLRPESIQGLYLNFRYDGTNLQCVTGTSMNIFTMDKSLEKAWDEAVREFFSKKGIEWDAGM